MKARLEETLFDVERSESFLTSDSFERSINPGLDVLGVGSIGLPLSPEAAKKIIQAGKGSETPMDESARKACELNADQFFLRNSAWTRQIQKLLQAAVPGLKAKPTG